MNTAQTTNPATQASPPAAQAVAPDSVIGWPSLKSERIQLALRELPGWEMAADERSIRLWVRYSDPAMALSFAQFAFTVGRRLAHFPELRLIGGSLEIVAWTPESNGVTEQDLGIARMLTPAYEKPS